MENVVRCQALKLQDMGPVSEFQQKTCRPNGAAEALNEPRWMCATPGQILMNPLREFPIGV